VSVRRGWGRSVTPEGRTKGLSRMVQWLTSLQTPHQETRSPMTMTMDTISISVTTAWGEIRATAVRSGQSSQAAPDGSRLSQDGILPHCPVMV